MNIRLLVDMSTTMPAGKIVDAAIQPVFMTGDYNQAATYDENGTFYCLQKEQYAILDTLPGKISLAPAPLVNNSAPVSLHDAIGGPVKKVTVEFFEKPSKAGV